MNEHTRRLLAPKIKSVDSPETLGAFARAHWFCQVCGRARTLTQHHIIGGRGGRSDEECNLMSCCWVPCHSQFADHSVNLPVVLAMKLRAGELSEADIDRLTVLHGRTLDFVPIPAEMLVQFEQRKPDAMRSAAAKAVHAWSREAMSLTAMLAVAVRRTGLTVG